MRSSLLALMQGGNYALDPKWLRDSWTDATVRKIHQVYGMAFSMVGGNTKSARSSWWTYLWQIRHRMILNDHNQPAFHMKQTAGDLEISRMSG